MLLLLLLSSLFLSLILSFHIFFWFFATFLQLSQKDNYINHISQGDMSFIAPKSNLHIWLLLPATKALMQRQTTTKKKNFVSVWYTPMVTFIHYDEQWLIVTLPLHSSVNIHHYSPPFWWIIVNYCIMICIHWN